MAAARVGMLLVFVALGLRQVCWLGRKDFFVEWPWGYSCALSFKQKYTMQTSELKDLPQRSAGALFINHCFLIIISKA